MIQAGVLAHVPIGLYSMPVPLVAVLAASVVVVAASFVLIYLAPPEAPDAGDPGILVPSQVVALMTLAAAAYIVFLVWAATFGRQGLAALNAGSLLFWTFTIPLLPLAHCFLGGMYQVANPFAYAARVLSGGHRLVDADRVLQRLGYWPAVVLMFALVMGESISEVVQNPMVLGLTATGYVAIQVSMGILLGDAWFRGGEVFDAVTSLASTMAPAALLRDDAGRVRLRIGFDPARFLPVGGGRQALITLWLAGVLADGVRATPIWRSLILPHTQATFESMGKVAGVDLGAATEITLEVVLTWIAFAAFFWTFVLVASVLSSHGEDALDWVRLSRIAEIVAPSLIPIAIAYLFAHNLTQLLVVGPLIVTARDAAPAQLGGLVQQQIKHLSPSWVWWTQVATIVIGHVIAVLMAHARLHREMGTEAVTAGGATRFAARTDDAVFAADLGWLSAMLIYTATSLWVLAQPITAGR